MEHTWKKIKKSHLTFGTWNVKTLYLKGKLDNFILKAEDMKVIWDMKLKILGLLEPDG